jgi:hypothetical protein
MFEPGEPHFAFAEFLCYVGRGVYVVPLDRHFVLDTILRYVLFQFISTTSATALLVY